ncbi:MAG: recombinase family protein, partial [Ruminococcus sp.]|nr:recombinase family protein [Ruminococcus sp.]
KKRKMAEEAELRKEREEWGKLLKGMEALEDSIPAAMAGDFALTMEELAEAIRKHRKKTAEKEQAIREKEARIKGMESEETGEAWEEIKKKIPSWQQIFQEADPDTHRVLVSKLTERIQVTQGQIVIRFRFR